MISRAEQEPPPATANSRLVTSRRRSAPSAETRRPPEPLRPIPAAQAGTGLLSVRLRRRRFHLRDGLPPQAGDAWS